MQQPHYPRKPVPRRAFMLGGLAFVTLATSGCLADTKESDEAQRVDVPARLPSTFEEQARWDAVVSAGTVPVATDLGIVATTPGRTDESLYRVTMLDPATGKQRWISDDFASAATPTLHYTQAASTPWVVVITTDEDDTPTVHSYRPTGTGDRRTPTASAALAGGDESPTVRVDPRGVTVGKAADAPDGGVLDVSTGKVVAWDGPGKLAAAWGEGALVSAPDKESSFGYVVGGKVAWSSASVEPPEGASGGDGDVTLVGFGDGLVVGHWGEASGGVLALHAVRTGEVVAVIPEVSLEDAQGAAGAAVRTSADGDWAVWGAGFLFGLRDATGMRVALNGGAVTLLYQDVLYVRGAQAVLAAGQEPSPSDAGGGPSDGGGASDAGGADVPAAGAPGLDDGHVGMVDAGTGNPLGDGSAVTVPWAISTLTQGLFVIEAGEENRLYSVALS